MPYDKDGIFLEQQDCFEFLKGIKDNSVNLVATDPPYEISKKTGFASGGGEPRFAVSMDFGKWDKNFEGLAEVVNHFYRILCKGGTAIIFYDLWKISYLKEMMEAAGFKQLRFIEWIKTNPVPLNSKVNYLTNAREVALVGVKVGKPIFHSKYDKGIYEYPIYHGRDRFHPTQKHPDLFVELLEKHSHRGHIVVDPFSGSGTTAVACLKTGRKFLGCEKNRDYYRKSVRRIRDHRDRLDNPAPVSKRSPKKASGQRRKKTSGQRRKSISRKSPGSSLQNKLFEDLKIHMNK